MKTKIALMLATICSFVCLAIAVADDDVLKNRHFYNETQHFSGSPLPWVNVEEIRVEENSQVQRLRKWLVDHEHTHGVWPPRYESRQSAVELVTSWQKLRKLAVAEESRLMKSPDTGILAVTFWVYGHNIDEPGAGEHAYALLDRLEKNFPDSGFLEMARGMLLVKTGGKGAETALRNAYKKLANANDRGLTQLAIATQCQIGRKPHKMVTALEKAMTECPGCGNKYLSSINLMSSVIGHNPSMARANPYMVQVEQGKTYVGSGLYGFMLELPGSWSPDKYTPYNPENPLGYLLLDAEPLPGSGLVHGMMVFTAALPDPGVQHPQMYQKFFFGQPGTTATKIEPLARSRYLTDWYRLDTDRPVGPNDTITSIVASGIVHPKTWSISDHAQLAGKEGECRTPQGEPEKLSFFSMQSRIDAPLEITFIYNASGKSYKVAASNMAKILSTLVIQDHARSEAFVRQ